MSTLTDFVSTYAIDVLVRVTLILGLAYVLARLVRPRAACQHAILLAGLAAACLVPATMLSVQAVGLPRWSILLPQKSAPAEADAVCLVKDAAEEAFLVTTADKTAARDVSPPEDPCPISVQPAGESQNNLSALLTLPARIDWRFVASVFAAAWLGVALLRIGGLALSVVRLRRIVDRARPVESQQCRSLMAEARRRVGLRRNPQLLESAEVYSPIAAGMVGSFIVLPVGSAKRLSRSELSSVLCHEAAHLARGDHRVVVVQELLAGLLWFHPLVHLINRALNRAREEICDNFAIRSVDRPAYCAALYRLAGKASGAPVLAATSMSTRRWPLEERIRGILDDRRPTMTSIPLTVRSMILLMAVTVCGLAALPQVAASEASDDPTAKQSADQEISARIAEQRGKAAEQVKAAIQQAATARRQAEAAKAQAKAAAAQAKVAMEQGEIVAIQAKSKALAVAGNTAQQLRQVQELPESVRSLHVKSLDSDVRIVPAADGFLHVEAIVSAETNAKPGDPDRPGLEQFVRINSSSDDVEIAVLPPSDDEHEGRVSLVVALPRELAISAKTQEGDLVISVAGGEFALKTVEGQIVLNASTAKSVTAKSADGNIAINAGTVDGNVAVKTSDGQISIRSDNIQGEVNAKSSDGNIAVNVDRLHGTAAAVSADGNIEVNIRESQGDLAALSSDGNIEFTLGESSGRLAISSGDGNLRANIGSAKRAGIETAEGDIQIHLTDEGLRDGLVAQSDGGIVKLLVSPQVNADVAMVSEEGTIWINGQAVDTQTTSKRIGKGGAAYQITTGDGSIHVGTIETMAPDGKKNTYKVETNESGETTVTPAP